MRTLAEEISYDAATGIFTSLVNKRGWPKGREVGGWHNAGYRTLKHDGVLYKAHRVAWFLHFGYWPLGEIDHINGNRADNRIVNLRDVSKEKNQWNARKRSDNSTGYKGVSKKKWRNNIKWCARIRVNGIRQTLGYFNTPEEAFSSYVSASKELHGEYGRVE